MGVSRDVVRQALHGGNNPFMGPTPFDLPVNPAVAPGVPGSMFDPSMGRGFRLGDIKTINAGQSIGVAQWGYPDRWAHWKVTLRLALASGVAQPVQGRGILVNITAKIENEVITREVFLTWGTSQYCYVAGRSLEINAVNGEATGFNFDLHYSIEESSPGLARWTTQSTFLDLQAETALLVPPFCTYFQCLAASGTGPQIRGYTAGVVPTLIYDHTLSGPLSEAIPVFPRCYYTITNSGVLPASYLVMFSCQG
jgi:hypothetical protein